MAQSTLTDIRSKVRKLTGRPSTNQITDADIDNYVNSYYVYDLPNSLKLAKLQDVYTFETTPNVDTYDFDLESYYVCKPPVYCAGYGMEFYESNELFYRTYPKNNFIEQVATGDGGAGPYTGTLTNTPFLRSINAGQDIGEIINVVFTGNTATGSSVAEDDGIGGFLAPAAGTIDYSAGTFSVTFPAAIPIGEEIWAQYFPYVASRPRSILYFQNQLVLRPVPDISYKIEINVMRSPTDLLAAGSEPEINDLWELLAFGAASKILVDNGDFEVLTTITPFFEERIKFARRRTIALGSSQRSKTIYTQDNTYQFNSNPNI
jgi:hypothetical protein